MPVWKKLQYAAAPVTAARLPVPGVRGSVVQKIDIQRHAAIHPRAPLGLQRLGEGAQALILPVRRKGDHPIDVVSGATPMIFGLTGLRDVQGRKRLA